MAEIYSPKTCSPKNWKIFRNENNLEHLQVLDEKKITESTDFAKDFDTPEGASKVTTTRIAVKWITCRAQW